MTKGRYAPKQEDNDTLYRSSDNTGNVIAGLQVPHFTLA